MQLSVPNSGYYSRLRNDILEYVPVGAKRVLSVGCGTGVTEAILVGQGVQVIGIEMDSWAASRARDRGVQVLNAKAERTDLLAPEDPFDCLLYADILEHLLDPVAVLRAHVASLLDAGTVVVYIPNFRHISVFWQLFVRGRICYQDAGILDRTHIRLTTSRLVKRWFAEVGIVHGSTHYVYGRRLFKYLSRASLGVAREFLAPQVMVVGTKKTNPTKSLVNI